LGLDNYASHAPHKVMLMPDDVAAFESSGVDLCGGLCSDGVTSIRGKIYDELVLEATGSSLYREWLPPEDVQALSRSLDGHSAADLAALWNRLDRFRTIDHPDSETAGLQLFFRICAERYVGLIGSW
jgi:hypothetical protein